MNGCPVPNVPASVVDAAMAARAESQNPQAASELKDLKLVVRTLMGLTASCRRGVNEVSPERHPAVTA